MLAPFAVLLAVVSLAALLGFGLFVALDGQVPLETLVSKTGKVLLVLSIWPLMRGLTLTWADLGWRNGMCLRRQLLRGLGLGLITLLPVLVLLIALGVQVEDPDTQPEWSWWLSKTALTLLLAILISLAEEPVFRGVLLAALRARMSVVTAIMVSAFYYALLHFMKTDMILPAEQVHWYSGWLLFQDALAHLSQPDIRMPFLALFAVGVFLGLVRVIWPGGLMLCIGCHAAWVWQIKLTKVFFDVDANAPYYFLVSAYDGVIGPLVFVWLSLASLGLAWHLLVSKT
ncbi:MAG: CPBP family intramembrane glutamic endopeptidase [Methylococcales bacterium]|nr:CPBP family intramembrane glutamic endopeptidase [Methylococcales bacterium]